MVDRTRDEEREQRIDTEILADAYTPEEQMPAWHSYLSSTLQFPFTARCIAPRMTSPVQPGEEVVVLDMAPDRECNYEMFVVIRWQPRKLAIPLMQLKSLDIDEENQQAIEDWRYWMKQVRDDEEEDDDDDEYEDEDEEDYEDEEEYEDGEEDES